MHRVRVFFFSSSSSSTRDARPSSRRLLRITCYVVYINLDVIHYISVPTLCCIFYFVTTHGFGSSFDVGDEEKGIITILYLVHII